MKTYTRRILQVALCAALAHSLVTAADDDDKADDKVPESAQAPAMTAEQRHAVGIAVAHPLAAHIPDRIESLGLVLDTTALVSDIGDMTAAGVAERSTKAEVTRLHGLYEGGAGASVRMLEAAQAEQAKAVAQSRFAVARFSQHWGPLATMPAAKRGQLLEAVLRGRSLLLRADVPGRHSLGSLPDTAELDVDGISVPGRVLGVMQHTDDTQSVGLLIGVEHAPAGLGAGAHVPVALMMAKRSGLLLPRDAVLYDERGAYVFKQLTGKADEKVRYTRLSVTLLVGHGNDWLVDGLDDDDEIVVEGAGVLWSLEGMGGRVVDSDDDN